MSRAFLVVMDSAGIGGAPDAGTFYNGEFPDTGANTLGHLAVACQSEGNAARAAGPLHVPNLASLGLWHAMAQANEAEIPSAGVTGCWAAATEVSRGKDTPSGHWELAGLPVPWDWHLFPETVPAFPDDLVRTICEVAETKGILGNCHASGTQILAAEGAEHVKTGWPICYTSADSVLQIMAHETHFGLERLFHLCEAIAPVVHKMRVGRVIARPFVGEPGAFERTVRRRDYAIAPPGPLLSDWVQAAGGKTYAVGKIGDIFSMQGFGHVSKGTDRELMKDLHDLVQTAEPGSLTFANFVEFDSLYGHRRDVPGYARHLEWFDRELGTLLNALRPGDMLVVTADHGNDPTWVGTGHTRERVPVLVAGGESGPLGPMFFRDVADLVAAHLRALPK